MPAYRLYGRLTTGSAAAEAALTEAGADFVLIDVPKSGSGTPSAEYLGVNPRGQVPALALPDGTIVTECAAILLHIADAFPHARLAPAPGTSARATHDRWLLYFHANVYEGELRRYYPDRYTTDPACIPGVAAAAKDYVKRHYQLFEAQATPAPFAFGAAPSMLDLYLWMLVQWFSRDWLSDHCPKLLGLTDAVAARPSLASVHRRHFG